MSKNNAIFGALWFQKIVFVGRWSRQVMQFRAFLRLRPISPLGQQPIIREIRLYGCLGKYSGQWDSSINLLLPDVELTGATHRARSMPQQ